MALIVVIQERRYQIDIGHRASVYATNAVRPAKWKAARELAPGGNALPATNAVERANKAKARDRAQGLKKVVGRNPAVGAVGTAHVISPGSSPTA